MKAVEALHAGLPTGAARAAGRFTLPRAEWKGDEAWPHAAEAIPAAGWDEDAFTLSIAAARALGLAEEHRRRIDKVAVVSNLRSFPVAHLPVALDLPLLSPEQVFVQYAPTWEEAATALAARAGKSDETSLLLAATTHAEPGPPVPALAAAWVRDRKARTGVAKPGPPLAYPAFLGNARIQLANPGGGVAQGAFVSPEAYYANARARFLLEGQRCEACDTRIFPPRESCPRCRATRLAPSRFSGKGTVLTHTTIAKGAGPSEFDAQQEGSGEYAVAIVELEEGPKVVAQLADVEPGSVEIGDAMEAVVRRIYVQDGITRYGTKFRPGA